jgi:hypothetical protein
MTVLCFVGQSIARSPDIHDADLHGQSFRLLAFRTLTRIGAYIPKCDQNGRMRGKSC